MASNPQSSPELELVSLDSSAVLADDEICYAVAEYLKALLSDQRETGKCTFVDIEQMVTFFA
jgi:hypothetical protein